MRPTSPVGRDAATERCSHSRSRPDYASQKSSRSPAQTSRLDAGAHVRVHGKGRKDRAVPLTGGAQAVLAVWTAERAGKPTDPLFPTRTGRRLSRDAVERLVQIHTETARQSCRTLHGRRVHPHVLRHSCAMSLLHAGVDSSVIALWLGHADIPSTQPYIHADMTIKERALALVTPADVKPGRDTPNDTVLAYLDSLD